MKLKDDQLAKEAKIKEEEAAAEAAKVVSETEEEELEVENEASIAAQQETAEFSERPEPTTDPEEDKRIEAQKLENESAAKAKEDAAKLASEEANKPKPSPEDDTKKEEEEEELDLAEKPIGPESGVSGFVQGMMDGMAKSIEAGADLRKVVNKIAPAINEASKNFAEKHKSSALENAVQSIAKPINDFIKKMTAPRNTRTEAADKMNAIELTDLASKTVAVDSGKEKEAENAVEKRDTPSPNRS